MPWVTTRETNLGGKVYAKGEVVENAERLAGFPLYRVTKRIMRVEELQPKTVVPETPSIAEPETIVEVEEPAIAVTQKIITANPVRSTTKARTK